MHSMYRTVLRRAWIPLAFASLVGCADRSQSGELARDTTVNRRYYDTNNLLLAAARVALPPPGMAPAALPASESRGAEYLQRYCVVCHALPSPLIHSATDWPAVVRRMWLRIDRVDAQFHVPRPTPAERVTLLRYLLDNALKVRRTGLPEGPGRDLFSETCNRCHDLPDPAQHSPEDWVAVVMRMTQRMQQMLGERPAQADFQRIVLYLEQASRALSQAGGS